MSTQDLNIIFLEWLERKGYDKAARALRREAALPSGRPQPCAKMEQFTEHVSKELTHNLIKFRTDRYKEQYDNSKTSDKKRKPVNDENSTEMGDGEGEEDDLARVMKKQKTDSNQSATDHVGPQTNTNRCFLGNLAFKITEAKLSSFFADCGEIVNIQWVTDKTTGNFYGTAFVEFATSDAAQKATSKNGKKCMERPIVVKQQGHRVEPTAAAANDRKKMPPAPKWTDKPEGCNTLFMGNLSFEVSEDQIRTFFASCGSIYEVRFGARPDGSFNGIGWIQFDEEDALQKAVKLHGKACCGRPIRLDYA